MNRMMVKMEQAVSNLSGAKAKIMLFTVAVIWGMGFVASQFALDANLSSTALTFGRFSVATALLFALSSKKILQNLDAKTVKISVAIGVVLFFGFFVQAWGLKYSSPGSNAFITATNVVMVPFLWWTASKKRPFKTVFFSSFLCLFGVTVLSVDFSNGFALGYGDLLTLLAAFLFAVHITATGALASKINHLVFIFIQFLTSAVCGLLIFVFTENDFSCFLSLDGAAALLYLGVFSTCLCYFLQTKAQSKVPSGLAAIILSTESLFGAVFSVIAGYDRLAPRLVIGGVLIFVSVILPDLATRRAEKNGAVPGNPA